MISKIFKKIHHRVLTGTVERSNFYLNGGGLALTVKLKNRLQEQIMSLEQKIEALTVEIVGLKEVIAGILAGGAAAPAATEEKSAAKGGAKGGAKGAANKQKDEPKDEPKTSVHTLAELQKVLQDFKDVFGLAKAKKLLPDLGYENSKAVPADKIDEVFDHVTGLIEAEANGDGGEL